MKKRCRESGQVLTEYVIMLVIAVLLGWGLLVLCRTISHDNDETVELVSGNVP
ncbi:MAG: hypothetical protein IJW08_08150 [Lentisphaeria bacterium]|nr:hypothetical protein [Lentisphaeria bacterium]